jgi:ethanolamine ammonia-lyase small subunit
MKLERLRDFTPARVALGRTGHSLPTRELLDFQLAHARARDAVHAQLDVRALGTELGMEMIVARSAAPDRATYLRRPDLGRILSDQSRLLIASGNYEVVFIVADGLSALAVERNAPALLKIVLPPLAASGWRMAPVVIVEQGRVAIGDDIGEAIGAAMAVVLIGERPGLSSPDSLGVYLTWHPRRGLTDADRNCISNIRAEGLSHAAAAHKLLFLMTEARRRKLSGVTLKEEAGLLA